MDRSRSTRPVVLELQKSISTTIMISELCLEERSKITDTVSLGVFDVEHSSLDICFGFFVLGLLLTQLFFNTEVFLFSFLHLSERGVVGKSS